MEAISDFKMAAMQNVFFSIAPQWGRIDIQVVAPIFLVSRTNMGLVINCFAVAILKFKITAISDLIINGS